MPLLLWGQGCSGSLGGCAGQHWPCRSQSCTGPSGTCSRESWVRCCSGWTRHSCSCWFAPRRWPVASPLCYSHHTFAMGPQKEWWALRWLGSGRMSDCSTWWGSWSGSTTIHYRWADLQQPLSLWWQETERVLQSFFMKDADEVW